PPPPPPTTISDGTSISGVFHACETPRMLDADVATLLDQLRSVGAPSLSDGTVEEARRNYDAAPKPTPDTIARVEDRLVDGPGGPVPVRVYSARDDATDLPGVVFFHGGGWVLSHLDGHDALCRRLATVSDALVVSVGYRLAPEHPFPAPHDDCWAVTAWLAEHATDWGGDPNRIAVCGDSAGGNLAAGVALRARDEGRSLRLQALIYPCIDDRQDGYPSMSENAEGYFLTAADMRWFWNHYVPADRRDDPRAVPARADDLAGVAPAWVMTAEYDPLRDEGEAYAHRLAAAGVPVDVTRYPGVVHGFITRWHVMARAAEAHRDLGAALRRALA
ncbi:MAG: alpha/beta hydrolase, partial [Ilumatobacteraceae bacterium]